MNFSLLINGIITSCILLTGQVAAAQIGAERSDTYEMIEVERKAEFPGGEGELMKYIAEHLTYPDLCIECDCQGNILLEFIIEKDGSVSSVKTVRSTCSCSEQEVKLKGKKKKKDAPQVIDCSPACLEMQKEAEQVIQNLPKWSPAMQREKPVRMRYRLPLNFKLS